MSTNFSKLPTLKVKLLNEFAKVPIYGSDFSAGLDISSSIDTVVPANNKALISTGISASLNDCDQNDYYLRIAPRSGISYKNFLDIGAGVIDVDYRGEIKVLIFNHSNTDFKINIGDRIAQMIPERRNKVNIELTDNLDSTERNEGGFGSTGI
jgi:dUTP pyrophosphatase